VALKYPCKGKKKGSRKPWLVRKKQIGAIKKKRGHQGREKRTKKGGGRADSQFCKVGIGGVLSLVKN